jgi:hypothetical protein
VASRSCRCNRVTGCVHVWLLALTQAARTCSGLWYCFIRRLTGGQACTHTGGPSFLKRLLSSSVVAFSESQK